MTNKESACIRFLYRTVLGRFFLKLLSRPFISKAVGSFLNSGFSKLMIKPFIKKHKIDMTDFANQSYDSFNAFFTRKRDYGGITGNENCFISPCDGLLSVYEINENRTFHIKHLTYNLEQLLDSKEMAECFKGGLCLIFRLTPENYHRYCYACSGKIISAKRIDGNLHCVRPIAYTAVPVFAENSREYTCIQTEFCGKIVQMEVGALLVGRIHNYNDASAAVQGGEKGYFEFGGSTIIVLAERDRLHLKDKYADSLSLSKEIEVRLGDTVGCFVTEV